jgi:hypothetical protein
MLIALGTRNEFSGDEGYKNISVIKDLGQHVVPLYPSSPF